MRYDLPTSDIEILRRYQRNVKGKEYIKVTSILMLSKGYSPENVSECLGIDLSTIYRYWNAYKEMGLDSFLENRHKGYWGMLTSQQISLLRAELKSRVYTDSKSVARWIRDTFGIEYTAVYYADGVHPTHNSRSTYAWIEKGKDFEQPTVSGRDRVNINGIINAKDVTDVIALDCDSVNAESTKELYKKALERHPQAKKIYIISDNARYYKNKELSEWIKGTKIIQLFLPPYSPNLNLIERLSRFLRKKVINTHFYRTKELFRLAIGKFFDNIADYKTELQTLLTLNFRSANSHSISL